MGDIIPESWATSVGIGTHTSGDAINAVLAAAGYNFGRLIVWLRFLLSRILFTLAQADQLKLV